MSLSEEEYSDWHWQFAGWGSPGFKQALDQAMADGLCPLPQHKAIDMCYDYLVRWCEENIKGDWRLDPDIGTYFLFKDKADAMKFKLANV